MPIFYQVMDITKPGDREPFAVIRVDTDERRGGGVEGTVESLHWTREEAEAVAAKLRLPALHS